MVTSRQCEGKSCFGYFIRGIGKNGEIKSKRNMGERTLRISVLMVSITQGGRQQLSMDSEDGGRRTDSLKERKT